MNFLLLSAKWLKGMGHLRGFGIQSPTDFNFVTKVVDDKNHYPEYDRVEGKDIKTQELLLRIIRHFQPRRITIHDHLAENISKLVRLTGNNMETGSRQPYGDMVFLSPDDQSVISDVLENSPSHATLVVLDLIKGKDNYLRWKKMIRNERVSVSFELWKLGVIILDKKYCDNHYIINF